MVCTGFSFRFNPPVEIHVKILCQHQPRPNHPTQTRIVQPIRWVEDNNLVREIGNEDEYDKYLFVSLPKSSPTRPICSICLTWFGDDGYGLIYHLSCSPTHRFHPQCIKSWLRRNLSCPCCRMVPKERTTSAPMHADILWEACVCLCMRVVSYCFVLFLYVPGVFTQHIHNQHRSHSDHQFVCMGNYTFFGEIRDTFIKNIIKLI